MVPRAPGREARRECSPRDRPVKHPLLALFALALPFLCFRLGAKDVWDASEGRPLQSAREMRAAGEHLVQRTNGEPDLTKPPVYAWATRLSFALFGDDEAAGRLPSVLAALVCVGAAFTLAARRAGPRAGFLAGLALLTTARFAWQARLAELETMLAAGVLSALVGFDVALGADDPRRRRVAATWGGVALALAGAVKGPVALGLVLPPLLGLAWAQGRLRRLATSGFLIALLLAVAGAVAWPLAVVARDPAALDTLLAFARGENVGHRRDPTYYLVQWPLSALPWTPIVVLALARARGLGGVRGRGLEAAFVAAFVAQSLLPAKQTHYLIPTVFPLGAVLAGLWLHRFLPDPAPAFPRVLLLASAGVGAVAVVVSLTVPAPAHDDVGAFLRTSLLAGAAGGLCGAGAALAVACRHGVARTRAGLLAATWVGVLAAEAAVLGWAIPSRNPIESSRRFIEAADAAVPPGAPLTWSVFGSRSDALWHFSDARVSARGIPETLGSSEHETVERLAAFLRGGDVRYAIVTCAQADRLLASSVADEVVRDDAFRRKRRCVALVRTRAPKGDR